MNRKSVFLTLLVLISSFVLSACMGLIPLEEESPTGEFGPKASPQEQHAQTFEALWKHLEDNYIYFETAEIDWDALHDQYLERIDKSTTPEEFAALIKELEAELPEGSLLYESRGERIEREIADASTYEGIGAFVGFSEEPKPHIILLDVIKGSPAEKAGLKAHDSIFAIDGSPVLLEEGVDAVERVRGPAGSSVTLEVQSPGTSQRSVEVKRGKLAGGTGQVASDLVGANYGYLLFPTVADASLAEDVRQGLQEFTTNRKLEGLILDLRIARSARGWPLDTLYSMFHNGEVGEFYNRDANEVLQVSAQDVFNSQSVPLVILVGRDTAGFPEIFAASLQISERAVIIGETTPGAIETSSAFYLPDGSQAYIESTSFRLAGGDEIGNTGVIPDIPIDTSWDEILPDQDPVLDRAIKYLEEQK